MNATEYDGRVFDRAENWDARNNDFPLRLLAAADEEPEALISRPLKTKTWTIPDVLDQGSEGACTGFGTAHMLSSTPRAVKGVTAATARGIYREAQRQDEWPGEDYEGSSVTGAMKAAKVLKHVTRYVWPRTAREVAVAISYFGPVVIGVDWYEGMMTPDDLGVVHVRGKVVGGHCVAVTGFNHKSDVFTFPNSWGEGWGQHGFGRITLADLDRLLGSGGDAALATKV